MIASLEGIVSEKYIDQIILDISGVGYGVLMNFEESSELVVGDKVKLYVHEHIRENNHDLFGFRNLETKNFFEQLLTVNGVGPKGALAILSVGTTDEVRHAISDGNVKVIQSANGVGKKVAERIIVDLKDKVNLTSSADLSSILSSGITNKDEAVQALMSLGFSAQDATNALADVDKKLPSDQRVKLALKTRI